MNIFYTFLLMALVCLICISGQPPCPGISFTYEKSPKNENLIMLELKPPHSFFKATGWVQHHKVKDNLEKKYKIDVGWLVHSTHIFCSSYRYENLHYKDVQYSIYLWLCKYEEKSLQCRFVQVKIESDIVQDADIKKFTLYKPFLGNIEYEKLEKGKVYPLGNHEIQIISESTYSISKRSIKNKTSSQDKHEPNAVSQAAGKIPTSSKTPADVLILLVCDGTTKNNFKTIIHSVKKVLETAQKEKYTPFFSTLAISPIHAGYVKADGTWDTFPKTLTTWADAIGEMKKYSEIIAHDGGNCTVEHILQASMNYFEKAMIDGKKIGEKHKRVIYVMQKIPQHDDTITNTCLKNFQKSGISLEIICVRSEDDDKLSDKSFKIYEVPQKIQNIAKKITEHIVEIDKKPSNTSTHPEQKNSQTGTDNPQIEGKTSQSPDNTAQVGKTAPSNLPENNAKSASPGDRAQANGKTSQSPDNTAQVREISPSNLPENNAKSASPGDGAQTNGKTSQSPDNTAQSKNPIPAEDKLTRMFWEQFFSKTNE